MACDCYESDEELIRLYASLEKAAAAPVPVTRPTARKGGK